MGLWIYILPFPFPDPDYPRFPEEVVKNSYTGCIYEVQINGETKDLMDAQSKVNVASGCPGL